MTYLLDTNHCSDILLGNAQVLARVNAIAPSQLAICSITAGELIYMAENSKQVVENLRLIEGIISDLTLYEVDGATSRIYGRLKAALLRQFGPQEWKKRRKTKVTELGIGENDLWIASVAVQHGLTVVSKDRDFVRIREVEAFGLESWS